MTLRLSAAMAGFAFVLVATTAASAQTRHQAFEFYAVPESARSVLDTEASPTTPTPTPGIVRTSPSDRLSAALGVAPVAHVQPAWRRAAAERGSQAAGDPQTRARVAFERGVHLAGELQWAEAAESFEESYRLVPRPTTLQNMALAHRALGRYTRSIEELQQFLTQGNPTPDARTEVDRLIREMRGQLARVTINPSVATATITLDDRPVRAGEQVLADPGNHVVAVTASGYNRNATQFTLARGEQRVLPVRLEQPSHVSRPLIVVVAVAVVAAIVVPILVVVLSHEADPDCGSLNTCVTPR